MSVTVEIKAGATVRETLTTGVPASSSPIIAHDSYVISESLNGSSSVPATNVASFSKALVAGAATITLSTLTGVNGATVNMDGLKVQWAFFRNPSTNANSITVTLGASNPYNIFGAAGKVVLEPGMAVMLFGNEKTVQVASGSADQIDISGTTTQALDCQIVCG